MMASLSRMRSLRGLALACFLAIALAGCGVNQIPTLEERAKAAWGEVENQYQRRADLVPNLVETVKGYAAHEKDVLEGVVRARAAAVQTQPGPDVLENPERFQRVRAAAGRALGRSRSAAGDRRSLSRPEGQPELPCPAVPAGGHREPNCGRQARLHRRVRAYNTELRTFPGRLWAMILYQDAQPMPVFAADPAARQPPKVSFGS